MAGIPLRLDFRLRLDSPLALPPGAPAGGPAIAGAALKGGARRRAAELAAPLGFAPCRADGDPNCAVCRLFGAPGVAAALRWLDAAPVGAGQAMEPEWRRRRPVSRALGTAAALPERGQALLPAGLAFDARAEGWLRADDPIQAERDAALVATAVQALDAVGGGRAVGYGRVAVALRSLHLGGVERDVAELLGRALPGGVA